MASLPTTGLATFAHLWQNEYLADVQAEIVLPDCATSDSCSPLSSSPGETVPKPERAAIDTQDGAGLQHKGKLCRAPPTGALWTELQPVAKRCRPDNNSLKGNSATGTASRGDSTSLDSAHSWTVWETFPVHAMLLDGHSEVLRTLLEIVYAQDRNSTAMGKRTLRLVASDALEAHAMKVMLKSMYDVAFVDLALFPAHGSVDELLVLLKLCDKYQANACVAQCLQALERCQLSTAAAIQILDLPDNIMDLYSFSAVKEAAVSVLLDKYGDLETVLYDWGAGVEEWQNLPFQAVRELLSRDDLSVWIENTVVVAIATWLDGPRGLSCTKEQVRQLVSCVRFSCVTSNFLMDLIPAIAEGCKLSCVPVKKLTMYLKYVTEKQAGHGSEDNAITTLVRQGGLWEAVPRKQPTAYPPSVYVELKVPYSVVRDTLTAHDESPYEIVCSHYLYFMGYHVYLGLWREDKCTITVYATCELKLGNGTFGTHGTYFKANILKRTGNGFELMYDLATKCFCGDQMWGATLDMQGDVLDKTTWAPHLVKDEGIEYLWWKLEVLGMEDSQSR